MVATNNVGITIYRPSFFVCCVKEVTKTISLTNCIENGAFFAHIVTVCYDEHIHFILKYTFVIHLFAYVLCIWTLFTNFVAKLLSFCLQTLSILN